MFVGCGEPQILLHVLKESGPINHSNIDNADEISISVVQHIDECNIDGYKKVVKINMMLVCNPLLKNALIAMISFSAILNFHVLRRLKWICMLAKDH